MGGAGGVVGLVGLGLAWLGLAWLCRWLQYTCIDGYNFYLFTGLRV